MSNMRFSGETYEPEHDKERLSKLYHKVFMLMSDGAWRTLFDIANETGGSEASCSARLRDFRKKRFGSHTVLRERVSKGLFRYRLLKNDTPTNERDERNENANVYHQ